MMAEKTREQIERENRWKKLDDAIALSMARKSGAKMPNKEG